MRYLIVGVDVGTTSAVAALDLDGVVVGLMSSRDTGVDKLVEYIRGIGFPAVIASDVSSPPQALAKIATSFGANIYTPMKSLSIEEKIALTNNFVYGNSHERDALAAALNAYRKVKNLLTKADALGLSSSKKYAILKGERIKDRLQKKVKELREKPQQELKIPSLEERKIRGLEKQRNALSRELEEKRKEIVALKEELLLTKQNVNLQLAKDKEVAGLKRALKNRGRRIKKLEEELSKFSQFRFLWNKVVEGEVVPVGLFPQKNEGLTFMPNKLKENEKKYLEGVNLAFTDNKTNRHLLDEADIPYYHEKAVKRFHGCFYVNAKTLQEAEKPKTTTLETIIEEYRRKRNQELT